MKQYLVVVQIGPLKGTKRAVLSRVKEDLKSSFGKVKVYEAFCVSSRHPSRIGSSFERRFCKELSKWFSGGRRTDIFYKTSGSGSRATRRKVSLHQGDVCAFRPEGFGLIDKVIIELKSYNKLPIFSFFGLNSGLVKSWWVKLCKNGEKFDKVPWLVLHKRNEKVFLNLFPDYVRLPDEIVKLRSDGIHGVFSSDLFRLDPARFVSWLKR